MNGFCLVMESHWEGGGSWYQESLVYFFVVTLLNVFCSLLFLTLSVFVQCSFKVIPKLYLSDVLWIYLLFLWFFVQVCLAVFSQICLTAFFLCSWFFFLFFSLICICPELLICDCPVFLFCICTVFLICIFFCVPDLYSVWHLKRAVLGADCWGVVWSACELPELIWPLR